MADHKNKKDRDPHRGAPETEAARETEAAEAALPENSDVTDAAHSGTEPENTDAVQETVPQQPETEDGAADPDDPDAIVNEMAAELELETEMPERSAPENEDAEEESETEKQSFPEKVKAVFIKAKEKLTSDLFHRKTDGTPETDAAADDTYDPDEDYIFFRPRNRRKKRRRKSRKLSCSLVLLTLIVSSGVVLAVAILTVAMEIYGINKDINEKVVTIPAGASTAAIAEQLEKEHLINIPQLFRLISRMNGNDGSYIAGEHVLSPSMSYQAMIKELCMNHADERDYVTVTFREGITLLDAAQLLEANEVCDADDFIFYFNAGGFGFAFENYLPETNVMKFYQREGYCFPDTYDFYIEEDPQIVAQKIYANFNSKMTSGDYAKMEELGMTLDEVVTLASIVQAEAADETQMRMIAGIFHNRLINRAVFDKLQSDPTRIYAETVIHENAPIRNTLMEDAYNTYVGQGLPPGAINNPGRAAIEAVLYPEESNYYYFVANVDTRVTYYAATYEEHLANIEKIRQEQAEAAAAAEGN